MENGPKTAMRTDQIPVKTGCGDSSREWSDPTSASPSPLQSPPSLCEICQQEKELVTDHNHTTGMVRGKLCVSCNSWLGVYEANLKRKQQRGKGRYKAWVSKYNSVISAYLGQDKGIVYAHRARKWLVDFIKRSKQQGE